MENKVTKLKKLTKQKGFTLVELLVVLVILGILAATIIPRMVAQTRGAEVAEAHNMLGALRRAQVNISDGSGGADFIAFDTAVSMAAGSGWAQVGMNPLPATRKYNYSSAGGAPGTGVTIVATNVATPANTVSMNLDDGDYTCAGTYTEVANNGGCR